MPLFLSYPNAVPITINYQTVDGTAKAGKDYQAVPAKNLTIPAATPFTISNMSVTGIVTSGSPVMAAVTSLSETGNVVTVTNAVPTSANTNFLPGEYVSISGVTTSGYNGTFIINSVLSATQFTYTDPVNKLPTDIKGGLATSFNEVTVHRDDRGQRLLSDRRSGHDSRRRRRRRQHSGGYNGTYQITVVNATTFTFLMTQTTPALPAAHRRHRDGLPARRDTAHLHGQFESHDHSDHGQSDLRRPDQQRLGRQCNPRPADRRRHDRERHRAGFGGRCDRSRDGGRHVCELPGLHQRSDGTARQRDANDSVDGPSPAGTGTGLQPSRAPITRRPPRPSLSRRAVRWCKPWPCPFCIIRPPTIIPTAFTLTATTVTGRVPGRQAGRIDRQTVGHRRYRGYRRHDERSALYDRQFYGVRAQIMPSRPRSMCRSVRQLSNDRLDARSP